MRIIATLFLSGLLITGCRKGEEVQSKIYHVASSTVTANALFGGTRTCLQVREHDNQPWDTFCSPIEGFDFEAGHEYIIEVRIFTVKNPPADGSSLRYVLHKLISKN
jgi:hypothetical protein